MGSCASVHKGTPTSAMKLGMSFGSKKDKLVNPESPIKNNQVHTTPFKTFDSYGSKEETFFDSQAWLDSDCDDDFLSVNGDFTPSRGNTPVHHKFSTGTPEANKSPAGDKPPTSAAEPSPNGKRRLSDLFKDSIREDTIREDTLNDRNALGNQDNTANGKTEPKQTILDVLPNSSNATPYVSVANSVCSSERTPNGGDALMEREKSMKSVQCCLPSLISCRSFSDRKRKMASPTVAVNGKV